MALLRDALMLEDGGVISLVGAGGKTSLMFRLARELELAGEPVLTTTTTRIHEPAADQSSRLIVAEDLPAMLEKARGILKNYPHVTAAAARLPDQGKLRGYEPEIINHIWKSRLFRWIIVEADGAAGRPLKVPADHEPVIPTCTSQVVGMIGLNGAGQRLSQQWVFRHNQFIQLSGLAEGSRITESAVVAVIEHKNGIFKNAPAQSKWIAFLNQADSALKLEAGRNIIRSLIKKQITRPVRAIIGQIIFDPPVLEVYDLNANSEYETRFNQSGE